MGENRDAANDVYEALHYSRVVETVPEAVPSGANDGVSTTGFNVLFLGTKLLGGATAHAYELYYYDGASWIRVENSADLAAEDFDPTKDYGQHYNVAAVKRIAVRLMSITGAGTVRVTTNIGI